MQRLLLAFPLILGLALAQVGPLLPEVDPAPPRPEWLAPGLAVTFGDGTGRMAVAYLVTRIGPKSAYGLAFTLSHGEAGPELKVEAGALYRGGSGPLYLAPEAVAAMARHPPPGIRVQASPGGIGWEVQDRDGVSRYAVRYQPETGRVLEMNGSYRGPPGVGGRRGAAFHLVRLASERIAWTPPPGFPPAARQAARYQVFYALPGGTSLGGTVTVTPLAVGGPLASYRVTASGPGQPGAAQQQRGCPPLGPTTCTPPS